VYFLYRLKESGSINTSLFMLSEVVDALNKHKVSIQHFCFDPFRLFFLLVTILLYFCIKA